MVMPQIARYWTPEMVRRIRPAHRHWPRYECVDGELLVTPAPSLHHQEIIFRLVTRLRAALENRAGLCALFAPVDFELGDSLVQPDAFVVSYSGPRLPISTREIDSILLTIEVLSPGSNRNDRQVKRRLYQREAIGEYWIVDIARRVIERWRPDDVKPRIETGEFLWEAFGEAKPIPISVPQLVHGLSG
jgi:Uma2 family endonuclease